MKGFSLVESTLAMLVIGAGFVAIVMAFQGSAQNSQLANQTVLAEYLAAETMERIIAQRDCNNTGCGYTSTLASINAGTYNSNPVSGFTGYVITSTVTEVNADSEGTNTDDFLDAQSGSGYARVTVQITWNNSANTLSLVTLIANY